jgi:hypothetical protein
MACHDSLEVLMNKELTGGDGLHGLEFYTDADMVDAYTMDSPGPMFQVLELDDFSTELANQYRCYPSDLDDPEATVR